MSSHHFNGHESGGGRGVLPSPLPELFWAGLVDALQTGVMVLDEEGRVQYLNSCMALLLDSPAGDALGRHLSSLVSAESRVGLGEALEAQVAGGLRRCEVSFLGASGHPRAVELFASRVPQDTSRTAWTLVSAVDITRRKEVEEDLEEQLHTQNTLLSTLPSPVFYQDTTGALTGCNPAFLSLLGLTQAEVVGKTPEDLDPTGFGGKCSKMDKELLTRGGDQVYEARVRRIAGAERDVLVKKASFHSRSGEGLGLIGILTDITDRKASEERLRRSEQELRGILENAPLGILRSTLEGRFLWANQALAAILGFESSEEVVALDLSSQLFVGKVGWQELVDRGLREGNIIGAEAEWIRKDESIVRVRLSGRMFQNESGAPDGFEIIAEDLSERDELEAQIRLANKLEAVGQLAAGIAHEINTPMQYIGDNVQFLNEATADVFGLLEVYEHLWETLAKFSDLNELREKVADAEESADLDYLKENVPDSFHRLEEGIGRVSAIVRAMKDFSHPDQMEMAPAELNAALGATLAVARNEYKYVADIETDFGNIPPVVCCPGDLNQAFLNLIVNAAHAIGDVVEEASGDRGVIRVKTEMVGSEHVQISIQDTGGGIPPDVQHRVFDPFFTTKEVGRGSGQGLAIVHAVVVERHGGKLEFDSESGKGTTFRVRLHKDGPDHEEKVEVR